MSFYVDELRTAGYTVEQCRAVGLDASEIRSGGYDDYTIIKDGNFNYLELRYAGIDIERFALINLYNLCNGINWKRKINWATERPIDEWQGVTKDGSGKVIKLDLHGNNLCNEIPSSITLLCNLQYLDLSNNLLNGNIPEEMIKLKELKDLWLDRNQFIITQFTRPMLQSKLLKCRIRL